MIRFDGRWTEKSERRTADYSINLVSFSFRSISNRPVHDELNARTNCFNANTRTRHSVIYPLPKREGGREREKKCSKSKWRMLFIEDEGDECVPTSQRSCSTVWNDDDAQWDETDRFSASKIVHFDRFSFGFLVFLRGNYHRGRADSLDYSEERFLCPMELKNRERRLLNFIREREIDWTTPR